MPTNETENYLRLHLLNNEAITVLRAAFLKIVDETCGGNVDKFLSEFKQDIIDQFKSKAQRDILFPSNGGTDMDQWDVSLLCSILLACCTLDGKLCINQLRKLMKSQSAVHNDIDTFVGYYKARIDQMKTKKVIDEAQYDILYPKNATSKLNEWDLNLLLCMLAQFSNIQNKQKFRDLLKNCISRDVRLYNTGNPDLTKYLKLKETKCKDMYRKGIIQQDQLNQLFPEEGGISDVNNWDDHLLQMFVSNVCTGLTQGTAVAIKVVKQIRNEMLAHKGSAEMKTGEFLKTWSRLFNAIDVIVREEVPKMSQEWPQKCEALNSDPFDLSGAVRILTDYYSKQTPEFDSVRNILQDISLTIRIDNEHTKEELRCIKEQLVQLRKSQTDMEEILQKIVGEKDIHRYTETNDIKSVEVKIDVENTNEPSKENALKRIRSSIQDEVEGKKLKVKYKPFQNYLKESQRMDQRSKVSRVAAYC